MTLPRLASLLLLFPLAAAPRLDLWPGIAPAFKANSKGFVMAMEGKEITADFTDLENSDDYVHIDFGVQDLGPYLDGGYVEARMRVDNPVVMATAVVADPADFWPGRQTLEGEGVMLPGEFTYRFYLDGLWSERIAAKKDRLYLFLHNLGGKALGNAKIAVKSVALCPPVPDWRREKRETYARQYHWPAVKKIEPLYYEELGRVTPWEPVSSSPTAQILPIGGAWKKKYFGERTWDTAFLADLSCAQGGFDDRGWATAAVPEPEVSNQTGGHFWYRKEFEVDAGALSGRAWLRFDDLADEARIYLNGTLVGTQTPVEKRMDWVVKNGSRHGMMLGVPVKKALNWKNFERVGVAPPFDSNAIPDDEDRLVLPIVTGQYDWPMAFEVGPLLKPGKNLLAVRLYGNPMRGFWIFRHREDRGSKNIYGLLGDVKLAVERRALFASFERRPAVSASDDGRAKHLFSAMVGDPGNLVRAVQFRVDGQWKTVALASGQKRAECEFVLPASFEKHRAEAILLDEKGAFLEARSLSFHGAVIEVKHRALRVNGEPFLIRGINGMNGVEWNNDRRKTRRESLRQLGLYRQLGVNAVRSEGNEMWELEDAFDHGMLVMPVTCGASTDRGIQIFGQYVEPDIRLSADRHRILSMLLSSAPNLLFWNGGNEIHHTPGYDDKPILDAHLAEAQKAFQAWDAYRHPVVFANLDTWLQNWFFFAGQDVIGWNIYKETAAVARELPQVLAAAKGRPVVWTEWGTLSGKKDRAGKEDAWEKDMRGKWDLTTNTPGVIGGFLYAFHGELEDERGRSFLAELWQTLEITRDGNTLTIRNRGESAMRKLTLQAWVGNDLVNGDFLELAPGTSAQVKLLVPPGSTPPAQIEARWETHRGLKHQMKKSL